MNSLYKYLLPTKMFLTCISICIGFCCFGQKIQFKQVAPPPPAPHITADFDRVSNSSIAFADIDGDSDQDVLITGSNKSNRKVTKLYKNDGSGNYSLVPDTPFDGVYASSIAFVDMDGDNDQDLLITGWHTTNHRVSKLYQNDGNGNFTIVSGTPFDGVYNSSIAFADVDGDNDQDLLLTGNNNTNQGISKLYLNNGSGSYTLVTGTPFENVSYSSIAFADIDGDNDQDILITGRNTFNQRISKLYQNNGMGNFTLVLGTTFEGVEGSSIAFADIDGDNDQDVLITGKNQSNQQIANLYLNDGLGNFSIVVNTPFDGISRSSIAFADADGDLDQDILITGYTGTGPLIAKLYLNDGIGNFSVLSSVPFKGVFFSSIAFADIDGDNDQDVLITGDPGNHLNTSSSLYLNNGNANYTAIERVFEGVLQSSISFADIDGDNDDDVLITGGTGYQRIAKFYLNDGIGNYSLHTDTTIGGVNYSSIAFSDVDNDNDQDVLITGYGSTSKIAKLYQNDGVGNFSLVSGTPFDGVYGSSIAFADIDGDNDQDVLITGRNNSNQLIAKLYQNIGNRNFTLKANTPFDGVDDSSIAFADVDGDNDQDVLITGKNSSLQKIAKLYQNDGLGNFSLLTNTSFDGVYYSSIAFADVDGDNDQDVLISGNNSTTQGISKLYLNNGTGNYSLATGTPFNGVSESSIAFSDIDGDNDYDLLITGRNNSNHYIAKCYQNDGTGNYSLVSKTNLSGVQHGSIAFADIDNDNFQDVIITGYNYNYPVANLYKSSTCVIDLDTTVVIVCDSLVWIDGSTYTSSTNSPKHTLTNANGCDSIITLDLTVLPQLISTQNFTVCYGENIVFNGTTYNANKLTGTEIYSNIGPYNCDSTVTVNLTILPQLASVQNETICFGDSLVVNGTTYDANNLNGTEVFQNIGPNNCDSTVTVTVNVLPAIDKTISNTGITLTSNQNGASYQWLDCNNGNAIILSETNQNFTPSVNGDYSVIVSLNGCSDTSSCFSVIGVGIIENNFNNNLSLYPNPTDGNFSIDLGEKYNSILITITDITGRNIKSNKYFNSQLIDLKLEEPAGIYLLKIQSEDKNAVIRLVKE